jgi:Xaa-Pro aminopeptidase
VLTVEPGICMPDECFGPRLENNVAITQGGPVKLMGRIPVETDEIKHLMRSR